MALPKEFRLKKQKEFDKVKQQGQTVHSSLFVVSYIDNQSDGPKFGFVVSKKIDKKAVVRNKIRRRLSEAIRCLFPQLKKDIYAVFLVKKRIKEANFKEIKEEIESISQLLGEK